jgi:hypothetical protein
MLKKIPTWAWIVAAAGAGYWFWKKSSKSKVAPVTPSFTSTPIGSTRNFPSLITLGGGGAGVTREFYGTVKPT